MYVHYKFDSIIMATFLDQKNILHLESRESMDFERKNALRR